MKKKTIKITVAFCAAIIVVIAAVYGVKAVQSYMFQAEMAAKYQVLTFSSEEAMAEAISGSWSDELSDEVWYIYLDNGTLSKWCYDDKNGVSDFQTKNYTLDYQNGRIVFDSGAALPYYDVIVYDGETYIRINPKAKKEEYYVLYERSYESLPE